jgi:hypothetical protein
MLTPFSFCTGSIPKTRHRRDINTSANSTSSTPIYKGRSDDRGIGSDHEGNYGILPYSESQIQSSDEIPEMDDLSVNDPDEDYYEEEDEDDDFEFLENPSRDRAYTDLVSKLSHANEKITKFKQQIATMRKQTSKKGNPNSKKVQKHTKFH